MHLEAAQENCSWSGASDVLRQHRIVEEVLTSHMPSAWTVSLTILFGFFGTVFFFSLNVVTFAKLLQRVPHVSHF